MTKLITKIKLRFDDPLYEYFNLDYNSTPIYINDYEAEFCIEHSSGIRIYTYSTNDMQINVIGIPLRDAYQPEYCFEIKDGKVED